MKKNYRLSITSILCFATLFAIVFLAFEGCKKEKKEPSPVGITNFSVSECLNNSLIDQWNDTIYATAIDDSKLKIRTTHTPFNCCSTEFSQEINVQENNITATMLEYGDPCDCICGRSVEFFLNNLEIGKTYTIILKHDNYEYFRFEVTFQTDTNLTFYTNPTPTPAPVPAPIAVSDFSVSDCLDHPQTKDWNDTIYVTAIDDIKLKIRTTHTPFNCCTTEFSQEINVQENDITITMHEDGDFCNCLCGRSMEFVLNNLEIGKTYTVILKHDNHEYFRFEVTFQPDTQLILVV